MRFAVALAVVAMGTVALPHSQPGAAMPGPATVTADVASDTHEAAYRLESLLAAPVANDPTHTDTVHGAAVDYFSSLRRLARRVAASGGQPASAEHLYDAWVTMEPARRHPVLFALAQLGQPYERNPQKARGEEGFDCSGLTLAAWHHIGVELPHKAAIQYDEIDMIDRADAIPGDLVFFPGGATAYGRFNIGHVGIYLGDGLMVNARAGVDVVTIDHVDRLSVPPDFWGRVPTSPQ